MSAPQTSNYTFNQYGNTPIDKKSGVPLISTINKSKPVVQTAPPQPVVQQDTTPIVAFAPQPQQPQYAPPEQQMNMEALFAAYMSQQAQKPIIEVAPQQKPAQPKKSFDKKWIVLIVLIILVVVAFVAYQWWSKKNKQKNNERLQSSRNTPEEGLNPSNSYYADYVNSMRNNYDAYDPQTTAHEEPYEYNDTQYDGSYTSDYIEDEVQEETQNYPPKSGMNMQSGLVSQIQHTKSGPMIVPMSDSDMPRNENSEETMIDEILSGSPGTPENYVKNLSEIEQISFT
jgi:hypothetical protein